MINAINPERLCMGCMASIEDNTAPCPHCGWLDSNDERSPHQLPTQTILNGKYLVGRVLGEGGFGITYLGWDINLDMKVAIKEYYPSGFVSRETTFTTTVTPFAGDKREAYLGGLTRFVGEAKSLAKFYSLPGIVSVKDFFKENGTAYIVMEYVDGITLKQHLKELGGKLPAGLVFDMVKPLMKSLGQMHAAGIIHRDISPDNIMITSEGNIKLLDFGAARNISTDGAKSLSVLLKPGYAPEEQYRSRGSQGPWTDVYALSATIYKAMTGETPPESMERMHEDILVPPSKLGVDLNEVQENTILRGLAILQKDRYQSVEDFYDALFSSSHDTTKSIGATMVIEKEELMEAKPNTSEAAIPQKTDRKSNIPKVLTATAIVVIAAVILIFALIKGRSEDAQGQRDIPGTDATVKASSPATSEQADKSNEPNQPDSNGYPLEYLSMDYTSSFAKVWEDWFYYIDGQTLKKMRIVGENSELGEIYYALDAGKELVEQSIVINKPVKHFFICTDPASGKDVIYYARTEGDDIAICKAELDGSNEKILAQCGSFLASLIFDQGWLYYSDYSTCQIYRTRPDGSKTELVSDIGKSWGWAISSLDLVYNGKAYGSYYNTENKKNTIYSVGTDGEDLSEYQFSKENPIGIYNGYLYYTTADKSLYRMLADSSGKEKIVSGLDSKYSVYTYNGTHIYYIAVGGEVHRMSMDGSDNVEVPFSYPGDFYFRLFPSHDQKIIYFVENEQAGWVRLPATSSQEGNDPSSVQPSGAPSSGQKPGAYPDNYISSDFHSTNNRVWKDWFYYIDRGNLMKFSADLEESLPNEVYYQLTGGPSNVKVDLSEVIKGPVGMFLICKHPETGKDVIFFSREDASEGSICIANLDGSGEKTLYQGGAIGFMAIDQGWLYFNDYKNCKINKMRLDGSGQETVLDLGKDWSWCAMTCVYDGWIYFVGLNPDWAPYKVRTNGQDFEKVSSNKSTAFAYGGYIYSYEEGLTRSRPDGSDKKQIIPENKGIRVAGGWIYYVTDSGMLYKSRLDGSGNEVLPYSYSTAQETFVFHPTSDGRFMYFFYEPMGPGWYRIED